MAVTIAVGTAVTIAVGTAVTIAVGTADTINTEAAVGIGETEIIGEDMEITVEDPRDICILVAIFTVRCHECKL